MGNAKTFTYPVLAVAGAALAYGALFELNAWVFAQWQFSNGVNWVFLPSGLRLTFVLLFGVWGALGIAVASTYLSLASHLGGEWVTGLGAGLISGLAPWLAFRLCVDAFGLSPDLNGLTWKSLLKFAAVFALVSPVLHQFWFVLRGITTDYLPAVSVMAIGDLSGTLLVLYAFKFALSLYRKTIGLL